jgi:non-ribosomal peptide synthetase-like protein
LIVYVGALVTVYRNQSAFAAMALSPLLALGLALVSLAVVIVLKNLLMAEYKPTVKPLWCAYVWFNEVVNAVYEAASATILAPMMGTPYVSWFLRLMGCKIGRWVFIETTLFSEFDLVHVGDRASLNLGCTIQTHLFEDRIMKSDKVDIDKGCTVGNMAIVLYGTRMNAGSVLGALSVLMKGEQLPAGTSWHGIPIQPVELPLEAHDRRRRPVRAQEARASRASRGRLHRHKLLGSSSELAIEVGLNRLQDKDKRPA